MKAADAWRQNGRATKVRRHHARHQARLREERRARLVDRLRVQVRPFERQHERLVEVTQRRRAAGKPSVSFILFLCADIQAAISGKRRPTRRLPPLWAPRTA